MNIIHPRKGELPSVPKPPQPTIFTEDGRYAFLLAFNRWIGDVEAMGKPEKLLDLFEQELVAKLKARRVDVAVDNVQKTFAERAKRGDPANNPEPPPVA